MTCGSKTMRPGIRPDFLKRHSFLKRPSYLKRHSFLKRTAFLGATTCAALIVGLMAATAADGKAVAADLSYTIGALPGPGSFRDVTFNEGDFNSVISYDYQVTGGGLVSDSSSGSEPGQDIGSWLFGFHLGPGFTGGSTHLDLTLTNLLGNTVTPADFGITSNDTPPGHPPPGTIGGGGRGAGLSNVGTILVPGHPDELRLLADLATPTSKVDNEYDLFIQGLGFGGRSSFVISGPIGAIIAAVPLPAALPLFAVALLVLGIFQQRAKRRRLRENPGLERQRPGGAATA